MSYDPNSNQNPELRRDRPDYENPNTYDTPNAPYDSTPSSNPNAPYDGTTNPYETSNAPYGGYQASSNAPYGNPPNAYETPGNPYGGAPNAYGTPNTFYGGAPNTPYGTPETPYGTGVSPRRPLPLGEAIRELPSQYIRVVTKPSTGVFAEEQGKAAWNIVWTQLIGLAILTSLLTIGIINVSLSTNPTARESFGAIGAASGIFAILFLIFIPIGFFIGTGIYHLIAKAFGGRGTYLTYCYCYLLFAVPLGIISGVLGLIPFVGSFASIAISVYQIVLQVYMTMAVHRLSGGKATLAVLILPIIGVVLGVIVFFVVIAAIIGATHSR
jgi:hypothetical protein